MKKISILLLVVAIGCAKGATKRPIASGAGLLTQEILVAEGDAGNTLDSVVTNFQYNASGELSQLQQITNSVYDTLAASTIDVTYNFTYSGSQIAGFTGTVVETLKSGVIMESSTTNVTTTFSQSGGNITGYIQKAKTTGNTVLPITSETANDSALITFDEALNVATYSIYANEGSGYQLMAYETFAYTGGDLTQTVLSVYVGGVAQNTVTTTYTYDYSEFAPSPNYLIPGVPIPQLNDLAGAKVVTVGTDNQTLVTTYTSTYNSANQPLVTNADLTYTPVSQLGFYYEYINYTYQ